MVPFFLIISLSGKEKWLPFDDQRGARSNDQKHTGIHPRDISWANLSSTNLCGCNLRYADCIETNLNGAKLSEAWLFDSDLTRATMRDANLIGADLTLATLLEADLSGANLSGAILDETSFKKAILHRAVFTSATMKSNPDFTEASVAWTLFTNVNLGCVKGLETVSHLGPSSIGIDTIYRSHGKIPESFLRHAGMPATFLELMRSLTLPTEDTTSVLSYAEADETFAQQFYADLRRHEVRCWLSCKKGKINDNQGHGVDPSLYLYDTLLLVLSEHSVNSDWIEHEIRQAKMKEQYEENPIRGYKRWAGWRSIESTRATRLASGTYPLQSNLRWLCSADDDALYAGRSLAWLGCD